MSDEKLRELERRWKETGTVEDEAKYLLERVRVGDLEQEKLELAAYCGHAGARVALADKTPQSPTDLREWLVGLERWGRRVPAHAVILLAKRLLPLWLHAFPEDVRPREALELCQMLLEETGNQFLRSRARALANGVLEEAAESARTGRSLRAYEIARFIGHLTWDFALGLENQRSLEITLGIGAGVAGLLPSPREVIVPGLLGWIFDNQN